MMRSSLKIRSLRAGGIFLSSLYFFLLGAASFCMFAHALPLNGESQHTQHATGHSTLCVWACQVSSYSSTGQLASTPEVKPNLLVVALLLNSSTITLQQYSTSIHSRAPPQFLLSLQLPIA